MPTCLRTAGGGVGFVVGRVIRRWEIVDEFEGQRQRSTCKRCEVRSWVSRLAGLVAAHSSPSDRKLVQPLRVTTI